MEGKITKIISKLGAMTGITMLLFNYVYVPKKQETEKENLQKCLYEQIEPQIVLKKWQSPYKYEQLDTSHSHREKTLAFPIARAFDTGGTIAIHIEPVMIDISPSDNFLASNISFDIPKNEQIN